MLLPTFSAQPAILLTKEDTPFLLANSLIFEGTYASVNSASFNSSNLANVFNLDKITEALGVSLSNDILILGPSFLKLILF